MIPSGADLANFNLGEGLGVGLSTPQIGYLAGSLFLALLGLSAFRRITLASGPLPAVWIGVAVGLTAGGVLLAARGFPDEVPEGLRPWVQADRLTRVATVLALLGSAIVFLSAHWLRGRWSRSAVRLIGLAMAAVAVWLAAGWFGNELPDDARPWAARPVVTRAFVILGTLAVAASLWPGADSEAAYRRWARRVPVAPGVAAAALLGTRWFGPAIDENLRLDEVSGVIVIAAAVATGTCVLIAAGAYFLRGRSHKPSRHPPVARSLPIEAPAPARPLPVAVLLDDLGRPVLPPVPGQPSRP